MIAPINTPQILTVLFAGGLVHGLLNLTAPFTKRDKNFICYCTRKLRLFRSLLKHSSGARDVSSDFLSRY